MSQHALAHRRSLRKKNVRYRYGKTAARPGAIELSLSTYLKMSALPTRPAAFGHDGLVVDWGMLGNDQAGNCVLAGGGHETMSWGKEANNSIDFTTDSVLSDYSAITGYDPTQTDDQGNNPTDTGTDVQQAADYRLKTGLVDALGRRHTIAAYVSVDPTNIDEMLTACWLFNSIGIGINCPDTAQQQFQAGQPWTVVPGAKNDGGHYIPMFGFGNGMARVVTWGAVQEVAPAFLTEYCDEAIAYLSLEMLTGGRSVDGFDLAALRVDLNEVRQPAAAPAPAATKTPPVKRAPVKKAPAKKAAR